MRAARLAIFTLALLGLGKASKLYCLGITKDIWVSLPISITTRGSKLDLNEIDAVWAVRTPGRPGDNFMIFDDYRLSALPIDEIPPTLEFVGQLTSGPTLIRVLGEPGVQYILERTSDFIHWTQAASGRATSPNGLLEPTALRSDQRFYRARSVR